MKKIYIVTTYTGTVLSYMIRKITKVPYSHVSISLNEDLSPMYSFGRLNPKCPFFGGFVEERIDTGLYSIKKNTMCRVYSLNVDDFQYEMLKENIENISENRELYTYDIMALIYLAVGISRVDEYKYVCSTFVSSMLYNSSIELFDKSPNNVKPDDFYDKNELSLEYEGLLSCFNREMSLNAELI